MPHGKARSAHASWLCRHLLSIVLPKCSMDSWSSSCALGSPVGNMSSERMLLCAAGVVGAAAGLAAAPLGPPAAQVSTFLNISKYIS